MSPANRGSHWLRFQERPLLRREPWPHWCVLAQSHNNSTERCPVRLGKAGGEPSVKHHPELFRQESAELLHSDLVGYARKSRGQRVTGVWRLQSQSSNRRSTVC